MQGLFIFYAVQGAAFCINSIEIFFDFSPAPPSFCQHATVYRFSFLRRSISLRIRPNSRLLCPAMAVFSLARRNR
jgi:hypothetical protein